MPEIIAEVGVNHNGDLGTAFELVEVARECGADTVKFQFFRADLLATQNARLAAYQQAAPLSGQIKSQFEMLSKLELSLTDIERLEEKAANCGLGFLLSVFEVESLERLAGSLAIERVKIPSGEITNQFLLSKASQLGLEIVLSTGMSTETEVRQAVHWARSGRATCDLTLLHCVSAYPAPIEEQNLLAIKWMRDEFGVKVGFSDHTEGSVAATVAVAMGAEVLEKHITLDVGQEGPDHKASADPEAFASYVQSVRMAHKSLGSGAKVPTETELQNLGVVRKSPYASSTVTAGDTFDFSNVALRRPLGPIQGSDFANLIGKRAKHAYREGEAIMATELD